MRGGFSYSLGLINGKVYCDGKFTHLDVYVKDQVIAEIVSPETKLSCEKIVDCSGKLVMPGFIDPHVHINLDLGEFKSSDDYESASKAAAFGGITTFIDFLEPINTVDEFDEKLQQKHKEAETSFIDYSFHTTIGSFKNDVGKLVDKSFKNGIPSIKLFTTYSESNRRCSCEKIKQFIENSNLTDSLILIHAENDEIILNSNVEDTVASYESSRPAASEIKEIDKLAQMVAELRGRIYIVHVTCGSSLELLKEKYSQLLQENIFIESCPQYFYLNKDVYETEAGNLFLLAPPLRSIEEQEKLKKNIKTISSIGTDHAPFTREEKLRYTKASRIPKGLGGLEYSFSLMYNLFGEGIIDKFTIDPAKIHKLYPKKGVIQKGSDADLVIFNPDMELIIDSGFSKSDYSPYEGLKITGVVESTILRGDFLVEDRIFVASKRGQFIRRE
ncbi:MAG: amidohydrolase family protein [Candidatus Heimdallarchaeota archaeon]|nr:amidohydrolase family protein [Candidatus Heimdallarchaeota archaeon]MCK4877969.1 amidohydrolase family protein [Candidatus Heimdallarchaeota archaeon]